MKNIIRIVLMSLLMNSCAAQSDFDLTQINLNKDKITDVAGPDAKEYAEDHFSEGKKVLITKRSNFLYFNNTSFIGQQNPDNDDSGINGVSFYFNKSDDIVYQYDIHIYSLNEAEKIIKTVYEKLGKPNYTYFGRNKDTDRKRNVLWEDQDNKILYCLKISLDSTTKASLNVYHNFDDIEKIDYTGGPFGSWKKYLHERKKKNDLNYTYQDFLKELKVKDPDDYTLKTTK